MPPHMRGKAAPRDGQQFRTGNTPACAGKSRWSQTIYHRLRDHPRVRGEKTLPIGPLHIFRGSPPRARGKVGLIAGHEAHRGITPACAGKSFLHFRCGSYVWDHPRVCGEKGTRRDNLRAVLGSPPRVRGKVYAGCKFAVYRGITPACAGKSNRAHGRDHSCWDHPRVCGEKQQRRQEAHR